MTSNNSLSQERISQKLSQTTGRKNKTGIIVAVVIALIVIAAIIIILVKPKEQDQNVIVTPDNVDEVLAKLQDADRTEPGRYRVSMNTSWEFENGSAASSNAYVENSAANNNDVYFDIVRSDTGDTIYKSPTIPIGSHLDAITLDTVLEAGDYNCVLTYHLLDESGNSISKLNIDLDITVKH